MEYIYNKSTAANRQSILTKIDHQLPGWLGTINKIFNIYRKHNNDMHTCLSNGTGTFDINKYHVIYTIQNIHSQRFEWFGEKYRSNSPFRAMRKYVHTMINTKDQLTDPWPQHLTLCKTKCVFVSLLECHSSLFLCTCSRHSFRYWLGAKQVTRHHLNQWWSMHRQAQIS